MADNYSVEQHNLNRLLEGRTEMQERNTMPTLVGSDKKYPASSSTRSRARHNTALSGTSTSQSPRRTHETSLVSNKSFVNATGGAGLGVV